MTTKAKRKAKPRKLTPAMEQKRLSKKPAYCTGCWQNVDLYWFQQQMEAGVRPIVHDCDRVLYEGRYEGEHEAV